MSKIKFGISVNLGALQSMLMVTKKGTKGIFIPIEANELIEGKDNNGNIYINCNGQIDPENEDNYGRHGFLAQQSTKKWAEQTDEEKAKKYPFLGNFKVFSGFADTNNTQTAAGGGAFEEDAEDLPF